MNVITEVTKDGLLNDGGNMGAHLHWDRNVNKAKRDGLESCQHCGKGMIENTGYRCFYSWENIAIIPFNKVSEFEKMGQGEWVRIGSTCVKNFIANKNELETYFVKAGA